MVEYALIAVLVILGIVVMGPYVLRSVNAHFKLWDEGVQDSFTENITQAPVGSVPHIPLNNCVCNPSAGSCGSGQAGSPCGPGYREHNYNCNPQGCNGAGDSYCVLDNSCCIAQNEGCGNYTCPQTGCPSDATTPPQGANSNNCYFGYEIQGQTCGANTSIQCVYNPDASCTQGPPCCPLPACIGTVPPDPNSKVCPGSPGTTTDTPLLNNVNDTITLVDHKQCTDTTDNSDGYPAGTPTPCQFQCKKGYTLSDGQCVSGGPSNQTVTITSWDPAFDCIGGNHDGGCNATGGGANTDAIYVCQQQKLYPGYTYLVSWTSAGSSHCTGGSCCFADVCQNADGSWYQCTATNCGCQLCGPFSSVTCANSPQAK